MGNNCCQRSKNSQELQYGQSIETLKDQVQFGDLLNVQRNSIRLQEAEKLLKIHTFDPSSHALPVALHHCITNFCIGLKPSIKEIYKISQNYSQGFTKNYFDSKFLISEYGVMEIQSQGSSCLNSSQLSKQFQIEFSNLIKQVQQHPYTQEIENLAFIVRKQKQSFAFSFKLNSYNQLSQKQEYILHTLHPFVQEKNSYNASISSICCTEFKGFDCGELIFESIIEFYEYLDSLFSEEDEDISQKQVQQSLQNTKDINNSEEKTIFIQLITFLSINVKSKMSYQSNCQSFQFQQQSTQSFIDLLNTLECDELEGDTQENKYQIEGEKQSFYNSDFEKENKRFSYLNTKSTTRFSHKSPQKQIEVLKSSQLQNQLAKQQLRNVKKQSDPQLK